MKLINLFLLFFLLFVSCNQNNSAQNPKNKDSLNTDSIPVFSETIFVLDSSAVGIVFFPSGNYSDIKQQINIRRLKYFQELSDLSNKKKKDSILDDARQHFTNQLVNKIIPFWYGTVWDFDGYTNTPNKGVIACGYFVSTTLRHMGIKVNRYKMAQQAGLNEAKTLEPEQNLLIYRYSYSEELETVFAKMKKALKDGLYFVGLSNHVGYIYVKDNELYFIHSNYIDGYVMIEKAEYSDAFQSNVYVIADITHNDDLLLKWIKGEPFPVFQN
ncbi:MAG: hypothetical protein L3J35_06680 [Bacteroidales bacterium]|nr:hypothetical protein [Bacteroidales bacterium]